MDEQLFIHPRRSKRKNWEIFKLTMVFEFYSINPR